MIKVNDPYFLYMAEAEGRSDLVNTRTARINAMTNEIKSMRVSSMTESEFYAIAAKHRLTDMSEHEYDKIVRDCSF